MVLGDLLTRATLRLFLPEGAQPRWYHALGIVGSSILIFSGFLGALVNFVEGRIVFGVVSLLMFTAGYGSALLLRGALERTVPPASEAPEPTRPLPVAPAWRVAAWADVCGAAAAALVVAFLAIATRGSALLDALRSPRPLTLVLAAIVLLVAAWRRLRGGDRLGAAHGALAGGLLAAASGWERLAGGSGSGLVLGAAAGVALLAVNAWVGVRARSGVR